MDIMQTLISVAFILFALQTSIIRCMPASTYSTFSCPLNIQSRSTTHLVFEKSCYEFVTNRKDYWDGARHDCNNRGGDLAIVRNYDTQYFLQTTLQSLNVGNHGIWIGLNDIHREGHFEWVDGSPLDYSHWAVNEGNGILHLTQDCVQIQMGDHGLWHDRECHLWPNTFSYICQYPSVETVHTVPPEPTTTFSPTLTVLTTTTPTPSTTTVVMTTSPTTTTTTTTIPTTTTTESTTSSPTKTTILFTTIPDREFPSTTTEMPNMEYPSSTPLPDREYPPSSTTDYPNMEYPSSTPLPDREYPPSSTTDLPKMEYPSSTPLPDREYPPSSTTDSPNREFISTVDKIHNQGHFLTPAVKMNQHDGCSKFICSLNCSVRGYVLGPDDCPICQCNV